jgi:hypothetical protein
LHFAVAAFALAPSAAGGTREAADKVRAGIASYRAGDYAGAAAAFQEADLAQPDDRRIAFDRGVALAAQGDAAKAVELLQRAALSPELDLAVRARYNLGCLAAAQARKRFGDRPEQAAPEARQEGLADLARAVGHFRDCLRLDSDHADARHNLEVIRLWIKSTESLWEQADRKRQRDQTDLAGFLEMLQQNQRALRMAARGLALSEDSPKRREGQHAAEAAQRKLGEEIGPLKEKIEAELSKAAQPPPGGAGPGAAAPALPEEVKQAIARLQSMADEAAQAISAAAEQLHVGRPAEAVGPQTEAVEKFDEMYRAVATYPRLVQRAVAAQQGLLDERPPETAEAAWNQDFVTRDAELLAPLAKEGLKHLPPAGAAPSPPGGSPAAPGAGPPAAGAADLQKQREGLEKSMHKAVELAPKVERLSARAAQLLRDRKPAEALPNEQEALKLLKEIADPLPKQGRQPEQDQKKENPQNRDKPDQKPSPKPDQKPPDEKQQQQEARQQQTEAAIRQVQERQQKRREMEKQLERYLSSPGKVDKDW